SDEVLFFSSGGRHTSSKRDWSSDVCSSDLTVVAYGYMVREALKAAEQLEKDGTSVEVIDLRTVSPVDYETIEASVEKTGRMVFEIGRASCRERVKVKEEDGRGKRPCKSGGE